MYEDSVSALRAFGGGTVFGRRYGSGPPTILGLHGWARTSADFDASLSGLDAIAIDLPGFGATPPPPERCGAAGYARLIAPVMEEFERPPVVVGHSFGGRVAVCLAETFDLERLILTGVPLLRLGPGRKPSPVYRVARAANRVGLLSDRRMESIRRRRGSLDYRNASGVMREILVTVVNETYETRLDRLGCPVDLVWGENDTEVRPAVAENALDRLGRAGVEARLHIVPGVGHMLPLEAPRVLTDLIVGERP